jgi:hypothetical protein
MHVVQHSFLLGCCALDSRPCLREDVVQEMAAWLKMLPKDADACSSTMFGLTAYVLLHCAELVCPSCTLSWHPGGGPLPQ